MALGSSDINHTNVSTELGISVGSDRTQSSLLRHATINKYSFYRSGSIAANASTKLVELTLSSSNDLLGDFRLYNHSASTPTAASDYDKNWGPGGSTFSITLATKIENLNVREIVPATTLYFTVRYYLSSANRSAKTNIQRTYLTALNLTTVTPPTDHTNNQTQGPTTSIQVITDTAVPTGILDTPDDILYIDTYISDVSNNELIRFDDSFTDVNTHEFTEPYVDGIGPAISGAPSGYTVVIPTICTTNNGSTPVSVDHTQGSGTLNYYWFLRGVKGSNYYRIGGVSVVANLVIPSKTNTLILNGSLNAAGASSNEFENGSLSSSQTWSYDDKGEMVITVSDWITGFSEYDLGPI